MAFPSLKTMSDFQQTTKSDPRLELIDTAHYFHSQGWMWGTGGNLSAKVADGSFWITASGQSKGKLTPDSFVRVFPSGDVYQPTPNAKPSAETSIHQAVYSCFPDTQACFHVHSIEANLVSRFVTGDELPLPAIEMLKGLGMWDENPQCVMPIFTNHHQVPKIAEDMRSHFHSKPPQIPALLIRDHGVTVWGKSIETASNYIEVAEYIFRYLLEAKKLEHN
jgi:methylthioribulose-1-phosphate dehydratase